MGALLSKTEITKRVNELMFRFASVKRLNRETLLLDTRVPKGARKWLLLVNRGEGTDETLAVLGNAQIANSRVLR